MTDEKMEKNPDLEKTGNSETQVEENEGKENPVNEEVTPEMDQEEESAPPSREEVAEDEEDNAVEAKTEDKEEELEKMKKELESAKDKYLRLFSEFENFRRRTARERLELIATSTEGLMVELLPVLDDFGRAKASIENGGDKKSVEGIQLIENKLRRSLEQKGLKAMQVKQSDEFNPELHEAVSQIPAPKKKLVGKVVEVIEDGYFLGEKVIRYAKVVIGGQTK